MVWTRWAMASIVLLAVQRALTVLVSLLILLSLLSLVAPRALFPIGESGPSGAAVTGGNSDPGAGSDSPGPYMTFDLFWEVPAQGSNVSATSPAGLENETRLENISWPLMEQSELILLRETLPVLEPEPVDKKAPQEGHQAVPVHGGNSEALQPTGVDKRFSSAEDTKTDPSTVEDVANTGRVNAKISRRIFIKAFLVVCSLIALLFLKVAPAWAKDIKKRLMALRANSELLDSETGDNELAVEV